jgi:hypothetical protein
MEIEKSVECMQLKAIFDEPFDRMAQRIEVPPEVQKPKTEKQLDNMRKKVLMIYLRNRENNLDPLPSLSKRLIAALTRTTRIEWGSARHDSRTSGISPIRMGFCSA